MIFQSKKATDLKKVQASLRKICQKVEQKEFPRTKIKDFFLKKDFFLDSGIVDDIFSKMRFSDYDNTQPLFFKKSFSLGNKIIIRSNINKKLLSY